MLAVKPWIGTVNEPFLWNQSLGKTVSRQREIEQYPAYLRASAIYSRLWDMGDFTVVFSLELLEGWRERSVEVSIKREIDGCLKELQRIGIRFNKIDEIREYLLQFPDIIEATVKIAELAVAYLPEAKFTLEVYQDPEIEDNHLVLYARFKGYERPVMERIRGIRRECRRHLIGKTGWLHLTTDFQPAG